MAHILEYDTVRIVALHGSAESHLALSESVRPPAVGDVGTVLDLTGSSDPRDPRTRFIVESNEGGAAMTWLAEFSSDELEVLSRPGSAMFLAAQPGVPELVARLRQQWLATASPQDIRRPYVERLNVLPLASDMGGFHGVTTAGQLLEFQWDAEEDGKVVADERAAHSAWFQAAKKYPEFRVFLPKRPPAAPACDSCGGTGTPHVPEHLRDVIVCYCGGAGWLPPATEQAPRLDVPHKKRWWKFWRR
jgi:hypothetical protein